VNDLFKVISIISIIILIIAVIATLYYFYKDSKDYASPLLSRRKFIFLAIAYIIIVAFSIFFSLNVPFTSQFIHPIRSPTSIIEFTPTPNLIVNLNLSQIAINIDAPHSMQINRSYIVKVSLTAKRQKYISTLMLEKAQVTTVDATPVGTPGSTLERAFGPDYEPVADATLSPSTGPFQITQIQPADQSLKQPQVLWKWAVIPLEPGNQIVDIDIKAKWSSNKGLVQEGRIGDKQISIDVMPPSSTPTPSPTSEPLINIGQINVGEIITSLPATLFGAGGLGALLIIWLITRHKKKKSVNSQGRRNSNDQIKPKRRTRR
jgi:hypothetical protein